MPKRGAQKDVCSSDNFPGIHGLNSTNSTDNTRFKLRSNQSPMTAYYLLPGSPTIGWYSGIVVFDVVRGEHALDKLMFNIMRVWTFVEDCR
jgi:hypothetical protein